MLRIVILYQILFLTFSVNCFAEMRKCVNAAGSVAFTNTGMCPQGYSTKSVTTSDEGRVSALTGDRTVNRYQKQYDEAVAALKCFDTTPGVVSEAERAKYGSRAEGRLARRRLSSGERLGLVAQRRDAFRLLTGGRVEQRQSPKVISPQPSNPALKEPRGAINTFTGEYYPPAAGGVINPRTGTFYQGVAGGYVDTKTGKFIPAH